MNIVLLEDLGCSPEIMEENIKKIRGMGHKFTAFQKTADLSELKKEISDADAIILANMPLPAEALAAGKDVKFIDVAFTGVDHIPVADAKARGMAISNASGYANDSVAELCLCYMVMLLRQINEAEERARSGGTKAGLSAKLVAGKTVGIIGAGAIGKAVAALCKAFGALVIAHNRRPVEDKNIDANAPLNELLAQSDIVSLHCPLTSETKGLIGKNELAAMKKSAVLINAARGPVVDNAALAEALDAGEIAGAAIDVFDMEPPLPEDYPLLHSKNTIVTPHLGFYTQEAMDKRARIVFDNLYAWLEGKQINII